MSADTIEQANTIKFQCAMVFTVMEDGSTSIRSIGENGDDEAEAFTDHCLALLREIIAIDEKLKEGASCVESNASTSM